MAGSQDIIKEYLVALGFTVDEKGFLKLKNALAEIRNQHIRGFVNTWAAAALAIGTSVTSITAATAVMINSFAKGDMEFKKFALHMYMGEDAAKRMKLAMDIMGESIDDIAWIPELREQFTHLIDLSKKMGDPKGWDEWMKRVRRIRFIFQDLELIVYHGFERVVTKVLKNFGLEVGNIEEALRKLEAWSMKMGWTDTISGWISASIKWFIRMAKAIEWVIEVGKEFWSSLTPNQKTLAAFSAFGLLFASAGPFGKATLTLLGLMAAYDDFQKTLRDSKGNILNDEQSFLPWKKLREFWESDVIPVWEKYKPKLDEFFGNLKTYILSFFDQGGGYDQIIKWGQGIIDSISSVAKRIGIIMLGLAKAFAAFIRDPFGSGAGDAIDEMNHNLVREGYPPLMDIGGSKDPGTPEGLSGYQPGDSAWFGGKGELRRSWEKTKNLPSRMWEGLRDIFGSSDTLDAGDSGLRGNNVGNIRRDSTSFRTYRTPEEGVADAVKLLRKGYRNRNLYQIGSKWAPSEDNNNPYQWAKNVALASGLDPNEIPNMDDPKVMAALIKGIAAAEKSKKDQQRFTDEIIRTGVGAGISGSWANQLYGKTPATLLSGKEYASMGTFNDSKSTLNVGDIHVHVASDADPQEIAQAIQDSFRKERERIEDFNKIENAFTIREIQPSMY